MDLLDEGGDEDDEDQPGQRHRDDQTALSGIHGAIVVSRRGTTLTTAASGNRDGHGPDGVLVELPDDILGAKRRGGLR
jgi:hypothetical protein